MIDVLSDFLYPARDARVTSGRSKPHAAASYFSKSNLPRDARFFPAKEMLPGFKSG
jgi:hypothetical protein